MKAKAFIFLCLSPILNFEVMYICDPPEKVEGEDSEIFLNERCDPSCIFSEYSYLTVETVAWFPKNCSTVCADLKIDLLCDLTEDQLKSTFLNMKHLIGSLKVDNTNYKNGKFLAGLETVECGGPNRVLKYEEAVPQFEWYSNYEMLELGLTNLTSIACASVRITSNTNLAHLNLPNLKNISYVISYGNKVNVTLDFTGTLCITTGELLTFIKSSDLGYIQTKGKYCDPPSAVEIGKVCNSTSRTDGCTQIFGSLVIGPDSEQFVSQLKTVEVIFGGLVVNKTNLTNIDFLGNLKYIYHLDDQSPAIQVENNPHLSDFSFSSLLIAQSLARSQIVFANNNKVLSSDSTYCNRLKNQLNITQTRQIFFDGKYCDSLSSNSARSLAFDLLLFGMIIYAFL